MGNITSIILGLYFFIYALTNVNLVIINSFNYLSKVWIISWLDGAVFILFSLFFTKKLGIVAVPLGLFLGSLCVSSWGYPLVVYRRSKKKLYYDFIYLLKNILVLLLSCFVFVGIEVLIKNGIIQFAIEIIAFIITAIILSVILPNSIKQIIWKKIKKRVSFS
jgi:hypothetical protein